MDLSPVEVGSEEASISRDNALDVLSLRDEETNMEMSPWIAAQPHSSDDDIDFSFENADGLMDLDLNLFDEAEKHLLAEDVPVSSLPSVRLMKWWNDLQELSPSTSALHGEILELCENLSPTKSETNVRQTVVNQIAKAAKAVWPSAVVHLFGSSATGLALPSSDVDVTIEAKLEGNQLKPKQWMKKLNASLIQHGYTSSVEFVCYAKVPILKLRMILGKIRADVSFGVFNGPQALPFVAEKLHVYPALKPLCLLLKCFLGQRNLQEPYTGGIGSYCLLNMIIATLTALPQATQDLGKLLLAFFMHYGRFHDYSRDVVSLAEENYSLSDAETSERDREVSSACRELVRVKTKLTRGWIDKENKELLSVEDPQAPLVDIGRVSFRIREARDAFAMAAIKIEQALPFLDSTRCLGSMLDLRRSRHQMADPAPEFIDTVPKWSFGPNQKGKGKRGFGGDETGQGQGQKGPGKGQNSGHGPVQALPRKKRKNQQQQGQTNAVEEPAGRKTQRKRKNKQAAQAGPGSRKQGAGQPGKGPKNNKKVPPAPPGQIFPAQFQSSAQRTLPPPPPHRGSFQAASRDRRVFHGANPQQNFAPSHGNPFGTHGRPPSFHGKHPGTFPGNFQNAPLNNSSAAVPLSFPLLPETTPSQVLAMMQINELMVRQGMNSFQGPFNFPNGQNGLLGNPVQPPPRRGSGQWGESSTQKNRRNGKKWKGRQGNGR